MFYTTNFGPTFKDLDLDLEFQDLCYSTKTTKTTKKLKDYHSMKNDDDYVLEIPVIGLTEGDLTVKTTNRLLTIVIDKKEHRWVSELTRSFTIPDDANTKKIKAVVENGLLTIHVPIRKESERIVNINLNK